LALPPNLSANRYVKLLSSLQSLVHSGDEFRIFTDFFTEEEVEVIRRDVSVIADKEPKEEIVFGNQKNRYVPLIIDIPFSLMFTIFQVSQGSL
jgi:HKD family nuclease